METVVGYDEDHKKLSLEFVMKSNGTVVYTLPSSKSQMHQNMRWHIGTQEQIINFANLSDSTINVIHQYGQIDAPVGIFPQEQI